MPMQPFYSKFPDLAARETRTVTVQSSDRLPAGEYGFIEAYCNETDCDCRRVLIQVMRPDTGDRVWATINYGWEDKSFYGKWMGGDDHGDDYASAHLDPLNTQSEYADELLDAFLYNIDNDESYVDRLKRHYTMFKKAIVAQQRTPIPAGSSINKAELSRRKKMRKMNRRKGT
ncbi:MAG: hypothetical protein ACYC64_19905 [Armatimonadota bacterium]